MRTACKQIISVSIYLLTVGLFVVSLGTAQSFAQSINTVANFPDPQFKAAVEKFMFGPGVAFTAAQAAAKTTTLKDNGNGITNITGLDFFTGLTGLDLSNNAITNIAAATLAVMPNLKTLNLADNQLSSLDLSSNVALETIRVGTNQLSAIGGLKGVLSGGTLFSIKDLDISNNSFSSLDLSSLFTLESLNIANNSIATLNLANNTNLIALNASGNSMSSLDLSANKELRDLNLSNNSFTSFAPTSNLVLSTDSMNFQLEVFDISSNLLGNIASADWARLAFLRRLNVSNNPSISSMNITPLTNLESLTATNLAQDRISGFTSLNTSSNTLLTFLDLSENAISRADLSSVTGVTFALNSALETLNLAGNLLGDATVTNVTSIHDMLRQLPNLQTLNLARNRIDALTFPITTLTELNLESNTVQVLSVTGMTALETLRIASNTILFASKSLPSNDVSGVTFPLDLRAIAGAAGTLTTLDITNTNALGFLTDGSNPYDDSRFDRLGFLDFVIGSVDKFYSVHGHQLVVLPADTSLTNIIAASNEIFSVSGRINPTLVAAIGSGLPANGSLALSILNHGDVVADNLSLDLRRNRLQVADQTNEMATVTAFLDSPSFAPTGELLDGFAFTPRANPTDQGGVLFTNEQTALSAQGIVVLQPNGGERYESPQIDVPIYFAINSVVGETNSNVRIEVSYDGGATFSNIQAIEPVTTAQANGLAREMSTGRWIIPESQDTSQIVIRISRVDDPTVVDSSDFFVTSGLGSSLTSVFSGATISFTAGMFVDPFANIPQVTVGVFTDLPDGLTGYKLRVAYDPAKFFFEANSVDKSGTVTANFSDPVVNNDAQGGVLRIISSGLTPVAANLGTSEIVRFKLNSFSFATPGPSNIALINSDTFFNDGAIDIRTSIGNIQVVNRFVWGDLSGDGIVGVLDAANVLRWAVGLITSFPNFPTTVAPAFPSAADLNADGIVGTLDASAILGFVADPVANPIAADLDSDGLGPDPIISKRTPSGETQLQATVNGAGVVKFTVANGAGVQGFRIALIYDKNSVSVEDIQSLVPGAQVFVNDADGKVIIAGSLGRSLNAGPADLLSVAFNAGENGLVTIDRTLTNINDGFTAISAGSVDVVDVNSSTGVPGWMLY